MRLKTMIFAAVMTVGACSLGSCGHEPGHIDSSWESGMSVKDEILLDGVNSQTINIKATTKPKLTCEAEWLKIGEVVNITTGIYSVELTAEPNVTGESRTAQVTVTAGKETSVIKVIQVSGDLVEVVSVEPQGDLDPDGGILTVRYTATGNPAANLPEWIRETGTRALLEGTLTFTYLANDTGRDREGMIVLATGKAVTNVTVRQGARTRRHNEK